MPNEVLDILYRAHDAGVVGRRRKDVRQCHRQEKTGRRQSRQVQEEKEGKRVSASKTRKGKLKKSKKKRGEK